jgi:hypothetical protein
MKKILVNVDLLKYCDVFNVPYNNYNRRNDYSHDYEPMSLTPQEIKDFLDKGISIKVS